MMKLRLLTLLLCLSVAASVSAQNYSFEPTNKDTFVFANRKAMDMYLKIRNNTTSSLGITWKLHKSTLDTVNKWAGFAFCDPSLCYYSVKPGEEYMTEIGSEGIGSFKLTLLPKQGAAVDTFAVTFYETGNAKVIDTLTFIMDARNAAGIAETGVRKDISVYPNPAVNSITLDIPGSKQVRIFDMKGEEVMNEVTTINRISVSQLKPGMYTIQAMSGNEVYSGRFLKE